MINITTNEKLELLKDTIYQLYSKEGRSKKYIAKLLKVNRQKLSHKIEEWKFESANKHLKPSLEKKYNKEKDKINYMISNDYSEKEISKEINIPQKDLKEIMDKRGLLSKLINPYVPISMRKKEEAIEKSNKDWHEAYERFKKYGGTLYLGSSLDANVAIPGYPGYFITRNKSVKVKNEYGSLDLVQEYRNNFNNEIYVRIKNDKGKWKYIKVDNLYKHFF